jgi:hypothetical protein
MPSLAAKTKRAKKKTATPSERQFDVASPGILSDLFTAENVRRTIKRMRAWQEGENEVSHPLRQFILLE